MAVEVVRGHHAGGAAMVEKYEEGASVLVDDGHLLVKKVPTGVGHGETVAVFAPGKWLYARVNDTAVQR